MRQCRFSQLAFNTLLIGLSCLILERREAAFAQTQNLPKASFSSLLQTQAGDLDGGISHGLHLTDGLDRDRTSRQTRYDPGEPELKGALVRWEDRKMPLLIWLSPGLQLAECPFNEIQATRVDYVTSLLQTSANPFVALKQDPGWTPEINDQVATGIEQWRQFENEGLFKFAFTDDPHNANICVFFCGAFKDATQVGGINIGGITSAQVYPREQAEKMNIKQKPVVIELSTGVNSSPERMIGAAAHEFGHALGIKAHSPYRDDIMYVDRVVNQLSDGDRATIRWLYHRVPQYVM
jgi:predicted Zn-dependent protease